MRTTLCPNGGYHSCVDESNSRGRYGKLCGVGQSVVRSVSVAAFALLASGAAAESPSNSNSPDSRPSRAALPQITVEAQRRDTEKRVHEFVSHVPVMSNSDESFARWDTPICPLIAGLPRDDGEFVLTRLSEIAASVGAPLGSRQCRANFIVLVTSDPVASLRAWAASAHYQHLFGEADPEKVKRFLKTQRAIRVWYNEQQVAAENGSVSTPGSQIGVLTSRPTHSSSSSSSSGLDLPVPTFQSFVATRQEWSAVWTISSVIEVVDADAMKGFKIGQMADYISMAGLAKFNLDADLGTAPTILRLFRRTDDAKPSSLSDWDKAYLKALYHTRQSSRLQTDLIRQSMLRDINP
jgi:hypothetical protein